MYTVYVLRDDTGKHYKGMTNDLTRRLAEHQRDHTKTTTRMKNPSVVLQENYQDRGTARKREQYLKTAAGRRYIKKILTGA